MLGFDGLARVDRLSLKLATKAHGRDPLEVAMGNVVNVMASDERARLDRLERSIADLEAHKRPAAYQTSLLNRLRQERDDLIVGAMRADEEKSGR